MANYNPLGGGQSSRGVKNTYARDRAWKRDDIWQPSGPQPFIEGRDPYKDIQRTPEHNFNEVGGRRYIPYKAIAKGKK